jgi:acyl-CoA synthetase (NDP forming)
VFASGFAEMRSRSVPMQLEIEGFCRSTRIRVSGPDCLGSFALPVKTFATFSSTFDEVVVLPDGNIAIVNQGGALSTFIDASMVAAGVGVHYLARTGNEVDLNVGGLLGGLADLDVLIAYLEDAARPADRCGKLLLLLKSGAATEELRAVGFHTGSQPGLYADFQVMVERHDEIRTETMEAVADAAKLFRQGRRGAHRTPAGRYSATGARQC